MTTRGWLLPAWLLACGGALGCEETPSQRPSAAADGGAPKAGPALDPDIAAAVREVAQAPRAAAGPGGKQPPETGVFGPGAANAEHPAGAPPKLTLGAAGGAPKLLATSLQLPAEGSRELVATVAVRTGPRAALPTLDVHLEIAGEAAGTKKKGEVEGQGGAAAGPPGLVDVVARLTKVDLSARQPGRLPPGLQQEVAKIAGSRLSYRLAPGGGLLGMDAQHGKGVEGGLERVVGSLAELLPTVQAPYPSEPVGAGAYWMVTSRERYVGLDVVAYRMFRVERVEGNEATLSVTSKRFVAGGTVEFPGLPEHTVDEFRGEGRGEVVVAANGGFVRAQLSESLLANLAPTAEPGRRVTIQLEVQASITAAGG